MIKLLHMLSMLTFVALLIVTCFSRQEVAVSGYLRLKRRAGGLLLSLLLSVILGA